MNQTELRATEHSKYDRATGYIDQPGYPWASDRQAVKWVPEGSRVLELGCATGYLGQHLRDRLHCRVTGVEQDPASAAKAQVYYERVIIGDLENPALLEPLQGPFDRVMCMAVLEHVNDPWTLLRRLNRLLAPQGEVIVSLPNIAHWSQRWQLLRGRFDYTSVGILDNTHLRFFTYETAQNLITHSGYDLMEVSIDPDAGIPLIQGAVRRLPKIGWSVLWQFYRAWPNLFAYQTLLRGRVR